MLQVVQNLRSGKLSVAAVPEPAVRAGHVVVGNSHSIISAGTERSAIELARKSLLGKARERPDQVKRVIEKLRNEGFFSTLAQVFGRLDEPMSLGYSSAGVVLACGAGVQGLKPGDRVASNGPHAGVVCVPKHLCAIIPERVGLEQAGYTMLATIAMQGVRLAHVDLGATVFVVGLGLIGQIAIALLKANGCRVIGTDPDAWKCDVALRMGAEAARADLGAKQVYSFTNGMGADAVLIAASTKSDGPVELAGEAVRPKGRVVAVGAVGLNLPRRTYYFKEAEFVVSRSYGPGRYDPDYEERGHDYPASYVRWTEQRNMEAVLDLMASGRLDLSPLTTHRFAIESAEEAYRMIEAESGRYLGVVLQYPEPPPERSERSRLLRAGPSTERIGVGCIGAGNFARTVLLPELSRIRTLHPRILCSAGGLSAAHGAEKFGFDAVTTDEDQVFADPDTKAVFILTRHDLHAGQVVKGLRAGKHVFVEKPLALTEEELLQIEAILAQAEGKTPILMVGFNRRFSAPATAVKAFFEGVLEPVAVTIRFNAGGVPADHWIQDDATSGGRIIGEACHAIDLATFLTNSLPVRVFAESVGGDKAPQITDDQCLITLRHSNGSISSIAYLSGGDKAYAKERVEVIGGGRIAVIDDYRELTTSANGKFRRQKLWHRDKGHRTEIEAFMNVVTEGGDAPIRWDEMRAVSLASILAVRSIREGLPFGIP